jgi:sirohydrochlorin cobaltochelatase
MRVGLLMMLEFADKRVERIGALRRWRERLADEVARWPRTPENDHYKAAVDELAEQLILRLGCPVFAAYNEFCVPAIGEAIDQAIAEGAATVVVVPTMLVRGNQHTELEIQEAVVRARERHPAAEIHYAWPFEERLLVSLLAEVVRGRLTSSSTVGAGLSEA